jgi:uncharacterized membrane protein YkvA (DUF1232 family)
MDTTQMNRQVNEAVLHEKRTGALATLLRQFVQSRGGQLTTEQIKETVRFVEEYIRHAPALLQTLATVAQNAGVSHEMTPILAVAEQYFLAPLEFIPDHLGLLGLMDDAYLAHCLVQGASDNYRQRTGTPLLPLPTDASTANQLIRALIGEPLASQLDMAVAASLATPAVQRALSQFPAFGSVLQMTPDPIWGNMSIQERVNHQMGMLGIF